MSYFRSLICHFIMALIFISCFAIRSHASHILGGDLSYSYTGFLNIYSVKLNLYGLCAGPATAFTDLATAQPVVDVYHGTTYAFSLHMPALGNTGTEVTPVCAAQAANTRCTNPNSTIPGVTALSFNVPVALPPASDWRFVFAADLNTPTSYAARAGNITNMGSAASWIALEATLNNSAGENTAAVFNNTTPPYYCINTPTSYNPVATDADGDALDFQLVTPYDVQSGYTQTPYNLGSMNFGTGYSATQPLATSGGTSLNAVTGQLTFTPNNTQVSVLDYRITERRNNVVVGSTMREINFTILPCSNNPPTATPGNITGGTSTGTNTIAVCKGNVLSFKLSPTDPQGDHISMSTTALPPGASLNIAGNATTAPVATITWNTSSVAAGTYIFYIRFKDDACPLNYSQDVAYSVTVTAAPTAPGIITGPANPCANQAVNYSVGNTIGNTYNWTIPAGWSGSSSTNTINATTATTSGTLSVTAAQNGCTSSSVSLPVTIAPTITPSVNIAASPDPAQGICAGTSLTFTATPVNGGTIQAYQWKKNGNNIAGATNNTYTTTTLTNGDAISVTMTSSATCAAPVAAASNSIATVISAVTPSVSIAASPDPALGICPNTVVNFTVTPVSGGSTPTYQWKRNGINVAGATNNTFTTTTLAGSDVITAAMLSSAACAGTTPVLSNSVQTVIATLPTAVTISSNAVNNTFCAGTPITFTANPVNGGTTPSYQWKRNGLNTATGHPYVTNALNNGDVITVVMTTTSTCATTPTATSPALAVTVIDLLATPGSISGITSPCAGTAQPYSVVAIPQASAYTWTLPNGWSGLATTNTIPTTTGMNGGLIKVAAVNSCGTSAEASLSVTPRLVPTTPAAISGTISPCSGSTQSYSIPVLSTATAYVWSAPAGWSSSGTANNPAITYLAGSTSGNLSVAGVNDCGIGPAAALAVNVIPTLTPVVNTVAMPAAICAGEPVTFTATSQAAAGAAPLYEWYKNGLLIPGAASSSYTTVALQSTDGFTVKMTSNYACPVTPFVFSPAINVNIRPAVTAGININLIPGTTTPCKDFSVTFVSNITDGGTTPQYQWRRNGLPIGGATGASYTSAGFTTGDTIVAVLRANAACLTNPVQESNKTIMTVQPWVTPSISISANPGTNISSGQPVMFTASYSGGGATPALQWMKNEWPIAFATGNTYTTNMLSDGDEISVKLTTSEPCATERSVISRTVRMNIATGFSNPGSPTGTLDVYPNPTNGYFTIHAASNRNERMIIALVNTLGQTVYRTEVIPDSHVWTLPIWLDETIANGIYQLSVSSGGHRETAPVLLQR